MRSRSYRCGECSGRSTGPEASRRARRPGAFLWDRKGRQRSGSLEGLEGGDSVAGFQRSFRPPMPLASRLKCREPGQGFEQERTITAASGTRWEGSCLTTGQQREGHLVARERRGAGPRKDRARTEFCMISGAPRDAGVGRVDSPMPAAWA